MRCQSVMQPSTAEYWHIGAMTMRFARASVPARSGVKRCGVAMTTNLPSAFELPEPRIAPHESVRRRLQHGVIVLPSERSRASVIPSERSESRDLHLREPSRLVVVRRVGQPMIALLETLERVRRHVEPRDRHVRRFADAKIDAPQLQHVRRWREAEIDVDTVFEPGHG